MLDPLSYKELEKLVKDLKAEKSSLLEELERRRNNFQFKEDLLQLIVNDTKEGILIVQRDEIKFANQTALSLLNYSHKELLELKFTDLIHSDFKGQLIQSFSELTNDASRNQLQELTMLAKNEQLVLVNTNARRIQYLNNQTAIKFCFDNIQHLKIYENEVGNLRKSIEFFDSKMTEGILFLSPSKKDVNELFTYKIEELNTAAAKILSKEKQLLEGKELHEIMIPDFIYKLPSSYDATFTDEFELYIANLKKYIQFNLFVVSANKIACKIADITDHFLTKQQLNKNLQRNELLTEILSVYNSTSTYDEKYKLVLERIVYHFKPKRILIIRNDENNSQGKIDAQYAHDTISELPNDLTIHFEKVPSWNKMLAERKMILGFTLEYLPEDLQVFLKVINMRCAYIFPIFSDKKLFGSIVFENLEKIEWDNTEINYLKMVSVIVSSLISRETYETNIIKSKEKAEEADRLKSSFLANMSHDIRIPMTAIIGFSDLLADPDLTIGEREEFVELISKSGQDLLTLIDNIIDVAKIETGQLRIHLEDCSLKSLLKEIYELHLRNTKIIEHDDLELAYTIDEKYLELPFQTDVFRFKQVLNNLIDNAIKFTDRGHIHFGISNVWQDTIEFYVQDTGIGIAEETQHIIFERFSKIDRSYTKEYNGTGLGLAISKSLIELMGGDIRVISYAGKGSTFYINHPLPKNAMHPVEKSAEKKSVLAYDWSEKTIMIAEDVEQNYRFLEYTLQSTKVGIVWVKNGLEAIEYVKNGLPLDLILMDIRMPVMNGIDAAKEIVRIKNIPIIAQTAYTFGDEKELALNAGCKHYLTKPINSSGLLELINSEFKYENF